MNPVSTVKVLCGWCEKVLSIPRRLFPDGNGRAVTVDVFASPTCTKWIDEAEYVAELPVSHGICDPCLHRKFPRRIYVEPMRVRPETLVFNNTLHDLFVFMWGTDKGEVRIEICGDNRIPKAGASVVLRNDFNTVSMHGEQ